MKPTSEAIVANSVTRFKKNGSSTAALLAESRSGSNGNIAANSIEGNGISRGNVYISSGRNRESGGVDGEEEVHFIPDFVQTRT
jgi:hypothetical protein